MDAVEDLSAWLVGNWEWLKEWPRVHEKKAGADVPEGAVWQKFVITGNRSPFEEPDTLKQQLVTRGDRELRRAVIFGEYHTLIDRIGKERHCFDGFVATFDRLPTPEDDVRILIREYWESVPVNHFLKGIIQFEATPDFSRVGTKEDLKRRFERELSTLS